jgi:hypothetical protein
MWSEVLSHGAYFQGTLTLMGTLPVWVIFHPATEATGERPTLKAVYVAGARVCAAQGHYRVLGEKTIEFELMHKPQFAATLHAHEGWIEGHGSDSFQRYSIRLTLVEFGIKTEGDVREVASRSITFDPLVCVNGISWRKLRQLPCHYASMLWYRARRESRGTLARLNADVFQSILSFASGTPLLSFGWCANTWGDGGGGASSLELVESVTDYAMSAHIQVRCGDSAVVNPHFNETSGELVWNDNIDSLRHTKPVWAKLKIDKTGRSFQGTCAFPGEGAIGYFGGVFSDDLRQACNNNGVARYIQSRQR